MDKEMLARHGRIIFGRYWQTALARISNYNPRTIRRYVSGETTVPDDIILLYKSLLDKKIGECVDAIKEIDKVLKTSA